MKYPNIYALFRERVEQYGAHEDERRRDVFFVRREGAWRGISWARFGEDAHAFASALLVSGLGRGASVCVLMGNVPEWPVCDVGTIAAGGVGCGLYPTSSAEQCRYIIDHADAEVVVVDTAAQLEKVLSVREWLPKVRAFVVLDEEAAQGREGVLSFAEFLRLGLESHARFASELRERAEGARADDTAIMVYTSGTTGLPKGACLSHRYVLGSVESLRATVPVYDTDVAFSYLPYCHVAERISGLYNRLYAGAPAYFIDDLTKLGGYMTEVRPTVFASLPRFFEKIHARVLADLAREPVEVQRRFQEALEKGRRIVRARQAGQEVAVECLIDYESNARPALRRVVDYFGGRLRVATSGGAPLLFEVAEFFAAAGLPILQAYGLTENICVAFNRADDYRFGTVGRPMPGCEVKIASDGEIMVRSEMMFSGYYREPEKTAEVMRDGWLLTGDLGEQDAEGFLRITGRKKELIVLSTGKKVAPSLVENMIKEHHLVSHAYVHGEGRSYLVALVTLNPVEAAEHARALGLRHESPAALAESEEMRALVSEIIESANRRVSSSESVKKFRILGRDFQVERDEVTPTLKVKRDVVASHFAELLQSLYT
ncbi:MAG: long-chain acyl-CoA synthetase [Acidobacteriota bacterium]|jgi:long-chain acyl-CoA synthetase|nr:long-chain acyl-CoA synthetase [Acidobacteriota bacterium]